ncbi:tetratricopeptide repeat protein [Candidatus Poribacteria bacterium]
MGIISARICDRLVEAGILLLIVITPIYYGSVSLSMTTAIEVIILLTLLVWGIGMAIRGKFVLRKNPLDAAVLLFCAYCVVSTLFFSRYMHASYTGLALILCIAALYFIVVNNIRSKDQLMRLLVVILLVGCIQAFSHLMQNAAGMFSDSTGVMLNVGNHFAGYMVIIIPLAVAMSFVVRDIGKRVLLLFAGIMMAAAMCFSLIAGAMLTFLLSLVFVALLFIRSGGTRKLSLALMGIVLCTILVVLWFGHTPVLGELLTVTNLEEGSPAGRLLLWKSSLAMFADSPITGTGLGTFDYMFPRYRPPELYRRAVCAHSDWLQLLTESGAVGFVIVSFGAVIFFLSVFRKTPIAKLSDGWRKGLVVGGLSSIVAGIAHALVDFNLHIPAIAVLFTIILGLTVTASIYHSRDDSGTEPNASEWRIPIPVAVRIAGPVLLALIVSFSAVMLIRPCIAETHHHTGMELEADLHWDDAIGKYRSASELSYGNGEYLYALGNAYSKRAALNKGTEMQEGWYRLATDAYVQAIVTCPVYGDYYLALGNLHELVGDIEKAENVYLKAIYLDPNNAFYHRIYGTFRLKQGDTERAITEYKKAIEVYPKSLYNILTDCYGALNDQWEYPAAHVQRLASSICPQDANSHVVLSSFFVDKEWYDAAFSQYQKAAKIDPEEMGPRRELSSLMVKQGDLNGAATMWQQFLKGHPQNAEAHAQLARLYVRQKRLEDALQQYLAAADIEDKNSYYSMRAADIHIQQGKEAKAVELWQAAIRQHPHTASAAYYQLGVYHERQGNWLDALDFFQKAISADPRNAWYHDRLAQNYFKRELFYEAIQEWKQALKLRPENISVHLQLAGVYRKIERQDKAKEHYRQVLTLQPENAEAQRGVSETKDPF